MKKAAKSKAKKSPAKKAKKAPAAKKMSAKSKKPAKAVAKPKAKSASKSKGMSVTELFLLKQAKEQGMNHDDPHVHEAPPHELHDKAHLQDKARGNTKIARGPGPGNRHH